MEVRRSAGHAVDKRHGGVGEGDARVRGGQHEGLTGGLVGLGRRSLGQVGTHKTQVGGNRLHRSERVLIREGVTFSRDIGLHRMAEGVEAAIGGEPVRHRKVSV